MFSLVVDDCIAKKMIEFRNGEFTYFNEIQKILQYYKRNPLFSNIKFLREYYGDNQMTWILSQADRMYENSPSIEELAKKTIYKIILTLDREDGFPYVNVNQSKIENRFCSSFEKEESRESAILHFKALLEKANYVIFYDPHLDKENVQEAFKTFAQRCFPQKRLNIHIDSFHGWQHFGSEIKNIYNQWSISLIRQPYKERYLDLHDRYIIIDGKIEVILTSGIEYLMDNNKDFTYIINDISTQTNTKG